MDRIQVAAKAIIKKGNKFLIIKEVIQGIDVWDLPGGKIEYKETPEEAVIREVKEEVGLDIKIIKLAGIYWFYKYRGGGQVICITYLCKPNHNNIDLTKNPAEKENIIHYRWVTRNEFLEGNFAVNPSLKELIQNIDK